MEFSSSLLLLPFLLLQISLFSITSAVGRQGPTITTTHHDVHTENDIHDHFHNWMKHHGKSYNDDEEKHKKFHNFKKNAQYVNFMRKEHLAKSVGFKVSLNKFSDMSYEEWSEKHLNKHAFPLEVALTTTQKPSHVAHINDISDDGVQQDSTATTTDPSTTTTDSSSTTPADSSDPLTNPGPAPDDPTSSTTNASPVTSTTDSSITPADSSDPFTNPGPAPDDPTSSSTTNSSPAPTPAESSDPLTNPGHAPDDPTSSTTNSSPTIATPTNSPDPLTNPGPAPDDPTSSITNSSPTTTTPTDSSTVSIPTDSSSSATDSSTTDSAATASTLGGQLSVAGPIPSCNAPAQIDWSKKGAVTPIKDQGECGSCWTFASTGALEAFHFQQTGQLLSLSEQELLDCVTSSWGSYGCKGGRPTASMDFVAKNGGITSESTYPYKGSVQTCQASSLSKVVSISGSQMITPSDSGLQCGVAVRPVAVGISTSDDLRHYAGGIYDGQCSSNPKDIDHIVLVVGYGSNNGVGYWIVKNSWGTGWGDQGYLYIKRNTNLQYGTCAIHSFGVYPK